MSSQRTESEETVVCGEKSDCIGGVVMVSFYGLELADPTVGHTSSSIYWERSNCDFARQ